MSVEKMILSLGTRGPASRNGDVHWPFGRMAV